MKRQLYITSILLLASLTVLAQKTDQRAWLSGYGRSVIFVDNLDVDRAVDSLTPSRLNSGHTLLDLEANIKPNENTYINAMLRVRNDYGGFWGGGITFDLRQLYVRGVAAGVVKYQLGDFDYKMTEFTFYNPDEELFANAPSYLNNFYDMIHTDYFYKDENTRRQQGAAVEFGLGFNKGIEAMDFNFMVSRLRPTDFNQTSERLVIGGMVDLVQSKYLSLGVNYTDILDLPGTSNNPISFHNPVYSLELNHDYEKGNHKVNLSVEGGASERYALNDPTFQSLSDWFVHASGSYDLSSSGIGVAVAYRNVGPDFRSPGAQTKRINFNGQPQAYTRIDNGQLLRSINMLDLMRDPSLYNTQLDLTLQAYNPIYNNIDPYGLASPNRKGITLGLTKTDENKTYELALEYNILSEVIGQGTDLLRSFNKLDAMATIHLDGLMDNYSNKIDLNVLYSTSTTTRSGGEVFETVDLNSRLLDLGLTATINKKLEGVVGYRAIAAKGNEQIASRDEFTKIRNFSEYDVDVTEQLLSYGLNYPFRDKVNIALLRQHFNYENGIQSAEDQSYVNWALIFKMKF